MTKGRREKFGSPYLGRLGKPVSEYKFIRCLTIAMYFGERTYFCRVPSYYVTFADRKAMKIETRVFVRLKSTFTIHWNSFGRVL